MNIKYGSKEFERDFGPLTTGDLLFLERDDLELTQAEMAKKLGISRQRLCDFEKGRRRPSESLIKRHTASRCRNNELTSRKTIIATPEFGINLVHLGVINNESMRRQKIS